MTTTERLVALAEEELDRQGVSLDWSFRDEMDRVVWLVFEWLKKHDHNVPHAAVKELYESYAQEVGA